MNYEARHCLIFYTPLSLLPQAGNYLLGILFSKMSNLCSFIGGKKQSFVAIKNMKLRKLFSLKCWIRWKKKYHDIYDNLMIY
jgi:hypothetical protein